MGKITATKRRHDAEYSRSTRNDRTIRRTNFKNVLLLLH